MKKEFKINGYIETSSDVSEEDFFKKLVQFVESNNWTFLGITEEIVNNELNESKERK